MTFNRKYKLFENTLYLILWLLVFLVPFLLSLNDGRVNWLRVAHEYTRLIPFLFIFLIHNFFLFKLLLKKEYSFYLLLTIPMLFIVGVTFQPVFLNDFLNIPPPENFRPKHPETFIDRNISGIFMRIVFSILVIGMNAAIKLLFYWAEEKRKNEFLVFQNTKNELEYLKNQISPHFFMNTLNNIHALIDYDKEIAKKSVVKLSKLMRVLLYEGDKNIFTLKKEIEFLNDYLELMKIRVNPNVDIKFEIPELISKIKIQPFLFINLVENAFKHGIRAIGKSFIHIKFEIEDEKLIFSIKNSLAQNNKKESGKIGLENTIKRFELIYGKNHTFDIDETDETFEVKIVVFV